MNLWDRHSVSATNNVSEALTPSDSTKKYAVLCLRISALKPKQENRESTNSVCKNCISTYDLKLKSFLRNRAYTLRTFVGRYRLSVLKTEVMILQLDRHWREQPSANDLCMKHRSSEERRSRNCSQN